MEALALYLLKASAILALFLLSYELLLKRETLFRLNRFYLLSGLVLAPLLPLFTFQRVVTLPAVAASTAPAEVITGPIAQPAQAFPWETLLLAVYLMGALACTLVVARQLWTLRQLIASPDTVRKDGFVYIASRQVEAPFSFFRYIFYNPDRHSAGELPLILEHERAHGAQWHSLDILLGRMVATLLWLNPASWWYQKSVTQNLEYLADARAVRATQSVREYQYTLLRVSGNSPTPALANAFNSSLIKKRIIMLQQTQSKSTNMLKHLLILPLLAAFLMAFNTETVYQPETVPADFISVGSGKTIDLVIDAKTTDQKLNEIKTDLAKDGIDFSYTTVRNQAGEITAISLHLKGKNSEGKSFSGAYETGEDAPIAPIFVNFDDARNSVSFSSGKTVEKTLFMNSGGTGNMVWISSEDEEDAVNGEKIHKIVVRAEGDERDDKEHKIVVRSVDAAEAGQTMVWHSDDAQTRHIEIRHIDGDSLIIVNGEKMDPAKWQELEESGHKVYKVKATKTVKGDKGHVMVFSDSDDESDIQVLDGSSGSFFFIDSGKGEKPLFFIDGKKASEKDVKALAPDAIDKMEVLKGDKATEQYGKKAKDGVVLITTKKN